MPIGSRPLLPLAEGNLQLAVLEAVLGVVCETQTGLDLCPVFFYLQLYNCILYTCYKYYVHIYQTTHGNIINDLF